MENIVGKMRNYWKPAFNGYLLDGACMFNIFGISIHQNVISELIICSSSTGIASQTNCISVIIGYSVDLTSFVLYQKEIEKYRRGVVNPDSSLL